MNVSAIGRKNRLLIEKPPRDGQRGIEERNGKGHEWRSHAQDSGRLLAPQNSVAAEQEPHKEAARIAEKDGRRVEVVTQKTKETAGQRDCGKRQRNIVLQQSGYQRRYGGEQADSGSQTIDAVDQVDGIGATDQPQHGKREVEPNRDGVTGDCIDVYAGPVCEERSTDLAEELLPRLQANQVIDEADEKNQGGGRRHPQDEWQGAG